MSYEIEYMENQRIDRLTAANDLREEFNNKFSRLNLQRTGIPEEQLFEPNSLYERDFINAILKELINVDSRARGGEEELRDVLREMGCERYLGMSAEYIEEKYGFTRMSYEDIAKSNSLYPGIRYIIAYVRDGNPEELRDDQAIGQEKLGSYMHDYLERSKGIAAVTRKANAVRESEKRQEDLKAQIAKLQEELEKEKDETEAAKRKLQGVEGKTGINAGEIVRD